MLYEFILKLSAKNAWRGQFLRVSKSIWRVKCIAKSHEIEDEFYDFILTKHPVHNHLLIFDVLKVQPADVWARKASLSG